jgi:hypothetical protein
MIIDENDTLLSLIGLCNTLNNDQKVVTLVILWAIWWARRISIHEQEFQSLFFMHLFIHCYLDELDVVNSKSTTVVAPPASATARWIPPEVGVTKIKINGVLGFSQSQQTRELSWFVRAGFVPWCIRSGV